MPRGNIHGRLERLEETVGRTETREGTGTEAGLAEAFFARALDAMAHVRRAPIDEPRWRYGLEELEGKPPVDVAAYVAALAVLRHPDEGASRERLAELVAERQLDTRPLWGCVDAFVRFAEQSEAGGEG